MQTSSTELLYCMSASLCVRRVSGNDPLVHVTERDDRSADVIDPGLRLRGRTWVSWADWLIIYGVKYGLIFEFRLKQDSLHTLFS